MKASVKVSLMAQIEGGEVHQLGLVELEATKDGFPDSSKLTAHLEHFGAAFAAGLESAVNGRMVGRALDIDPNAEFEANLAEAKERQRPYERHGLLDGPEHVIIGSRQEGKTRLAGRWLESAPEGVERVLVVESGHVAERMNHDAGRAARSPRIISYRTLMNQGPRSGVEYGIDESVRILSDVLGLKQPPSLVTVGVAESWQSGAAPGPAAKK